LARVITLVLVLGHSIENCPIQFKLLTRVSINSSLTDILSEQNTDNDFGAALQIATALRKTKRFVQSFTNRKECDNVAAKGIGFQNS